MIDATGERSWDDFSVGYEDRVVSITSSEPRRRMLQKHLEPELVLNMGTGPLPYMNSDLVAGGFRVVANDISFAMLTEAARAPRGNDLSLVNGDSRLLPFPLGTFDSVLAINSILPEHRVEVDCMLRESFRVLRPTGVFVGLFPAWEACLKVRRCFGPIEKLDFDGQRVFETTGWQCYQTRNALYAHVSNAGFPRVVIRRVSLRSKEEIESLRAIHNIDTSKCLVFEHLVVARKT
jgi:SAM-dependent methyltransferase